MTRTELQWKGSLRLEGEMTTTEETIETIGTGVTTVIGIVETEREGLVQGARTGRGDREVAKED
jgi:hypothetical protein